MKTKKPTITFGGGLVVGTLGGLIGLGGAEFRLPLLITVFGYSALPAVILNKALSLVVVASSLPFRATAVPMTLVLSRWDVIATLLAGSLAGAWVGADWATKLKSKTLYRILAVLLVCIAAVLLLGHPPSVNSEALFSGTSLMAIGSCAGFCIGVIASMMGVAGGELLIPTIVLLFSVDIKLAGSLSLAVSLPTMIVGFAQYSRDGSFQILRSDRHFLFVMAIGSILGAFVGGQLFGMIPKHILLPLLAVILLVSSIKVWRHSQ